MRIAALITSLLLFVTAMAAAAPAHNPEDAIVFIEVDLQTTDPATGEPRNTKVGEGSGFLIDTNGWVVTAAHVTKVEVPTNAKLTVKGSVRSREAQKFTLEQPPTAVVGADVALLRFPPGLGVNFPYLCVVKRPKIAVGEKLAAIGFPLGQDFSVRPGQVTSLSGMGGLIQTNLGLARGMSGGPVLDDRRAVIGVVSGGIEGQSSFDYFTPVNLALALFDVPPASYTEYSCVSEVPSTTPVEVNEFERSYSIDETYDRHPSLVPTTREYTIRKDADPNTTIIDARLVRTSDTRVSDLNISISSDRTSAELKFKLTAGPILDQYREWLHGQLILRMQAKL
jgi:hypothetical protein